MRAKPVSDLVPREALDAERAARSEAEERRARLARVFAQAPFAVAITEGPEHIVRSLNEMQRKLIGFRGLDVLNQPARRVLTDPEIAPIFEVLDEVFRQQTARVVRELRLGWDRRGNGRGVDHDAGSLVEFIIGFRQPGVFGVLAVHASDIGLRGSRLPCTRESSCEDPTLFTTTDSPEERKFVPFDSGS